VVVLIPSSRRSAAACITAGDRATGSSPPSSFTAPRKKITPFCKNSLRLWGF
jgi:hypothetical protein